MKRFPFTRQLGRFCFLILAPLSAAAASPEITEAGKTVSLHNDRVRLDFDLATGTYRIDRQGQERPVISRAKLSIDGWSSDAPDTERGWKERTVTDSSGTGKALDLSLRGPGRPELLFSFILYEGQDFIVASGGIHNTGSEPLRVRGIHVMKDGVIHEGRDLSRDFAMVDGFSGGQPLEYGERLYSPLTRDNALKSRNNILLTFREAEQRHTLMMGGLTYHDFEKFATIAQERRTELAAGADGRESLLCYLDLPLEKSHRAQDGGQYFLTKGKGSRTWENHEFRCSELATAVEEPGSIVIEARDLHTDRPYTLGFSWWQGLRHGTHEDIIQSVLVEYDHDGKTERLPLLADRALPRFDASSKEDVEQVELSLPAEAVRAGTLRVVVERADEPDAMAYLGEVWLRDGRHASLLPSDPVPVSDSPRPRRHFKAQLFAEDPVGRRVDPGERYLPPDRFYIGITTPDPFTALETYAMEVREAQPIEVPTYDFPTVCLWYAEDKRYGASDAVNTSKGAVDEMKRIADSGFLRYSRVAVRLVPDSYNPDNQQGWWDDEHWQRDDTDREDTHNGRYVEPYETSKKWGEAVTALGGIPLTYFQTAYRSEDYAAAFPGHMLFNKRYAWKGKPVDTEGPVFTSWDQTWTRNGKVVWGYDFTDPDFVAHMHEVYANLREAGIRGLMFDYPASGWASAGGMEDDRSTTAAAYRNIFRLAHDGLGPEAWVHERNMERGTDVTLGLVASMRTENDTDAMDGATVTRCGLRWYKNRVLVSHDTDSKDLHDLQDDRDRVRAVLTMAYVVSGRLLLANSFSQFSPETLHDLTRTFPYHPAPKSARPVDAFVADEPAVYDFEVTPQWHQVTFFNADPDHPKTVGIRIAGPQVDGALGLDPSREYHLFDFWNHRYLGRLAGDARIDQELRPGEARMLSVRECLGRPQVVSTDRHLMQGYLDLVKVDWDAATRRLTGTSRIIGGDPYTVTLALNGHRPRSVSCADRRVAARLFEARDETVEFALEGPANATVEWSVSFDRE